MLLGACPGLNAVSRVTVIHLYTRAPQNILQVFTRPSHGGRQQAVRVWMFILLTFIWTT